MDITSFILSAVTVTTIIVVATYAIQASIPKEPIEEDKCVGSDDVTCPYGFTKVCTFDEVYKYRCVPNCGPVPDHLTPYTCVYNNGWKWTDKNMISCGEQECDADCPNHCEFTNGKVLNEKLQCIDKNDV